MLTSVLFLLCLLSAVCIKLSRHLCLCFPAVSANLEESLASSAKVTLQAIGAQEAAVQAITEHTYKLKAAMEAEVHDRSQEDDDDR